MLLRLGFTTRGTVRSVPTVAVMIAALGFTGVVLGAVAVATMFRSAEVAPSDRGPMLVLFAFFGVMSMVMSVAGSLAIRSGTLVIDRDGETVRWRRGTQTGSVPAQHAELVLRHQGFGQYRSVHIVLVDRRVGEIAELGASVFERVARWECDRFAAKLGGLTRAQS